MGVSLRETRLWKSEEDALRCLTMTVIAEIAKFSWSRTLAKRRGKSTSAAVTKWKHGESGLAGWLLSMTPRRRGSKLMMGLTLGCYWRAPEVRWWGLGWQQLIISYLSFIPISYAGYLCSFLKKSLDISVDSNQPVQGSSKNAILNRLMWRVGAFTSYLLPKN